jgi:hypothetical protein
LPLFHDRPERPTSPAQAAREALCDALGVGLYRAQREGLLENASVLRHARERLVRLRASLTNAAAASGRARLSSEIRSEFADCIADARERLILPAADLIFGEVIPG